MITYHCYKTCPICGKATLRLIDGNPERGLWECENSICISLLGQLWDNRPLVKCPGRVDEREEQIFWRNCKITRFAHSRDPLAQTGAASRESSKQRIALRDRAGLCISCGKNDYCSAMAESCTGWERRPDPAPDLEAKKREFWESVGETADCAGCPAYDHCAVCADTLRAHYKRSFGGGR